MCIAEQLLKAFHCQELDSMILTGSFQLGIFHESTTLIFFLSVSTYLFLARLRKSQSSRSVGIVHWVREVLYRLSHVSVTEILNMICRGSYTNKVAWKEIQSQSWTGRASLLFHDGEKYISGTIDQFFSAYIYSVKRLWSFSVFLSDTESQTFLSVSDWKHCKLT